MAAYQSAFGNNKSLHIAHVICPDFTPSVWLLIGPDTSIYSTITIDCPSFYTTGLCDKNPRYVINWGKLGT